MEIVLVLSVAIRPLHKGNTAIGECSNSIVGAVIKFQTG